MLCWVQDSVEAELAALVVEPEQPDAAQFALNFIWLNQNIAVAVDQLFDNVSAVVSSVLADLQLTVATKCAECTCCTAVEHLSRLCSCCMAKVPMCSRYCSVQAHCLLSALVDLLAGKEESCHRVLLLAPKRCMGGAEGRSGGQALDPRTVSKHA